MHETQERPRTDDMPAHRRAVTIHTLGDSHCNSGFAAVSLPGVTIVRHHIGPKLMHSFGRDGVAVDFRLEPSDWLLLACGEIDCRCHIKRHVADAGFEPVIDQLVEQYESQILAAALPCRIAIYQVPPPPRRATVHEDASYPFVGEDHERRAFVEYLNGRLQEMCRRRGWLFFDVYRHYVDDEGFLNRALSDGSVHIHEPSHLAEFIRDHMLT